jgi:MFS family permease
LYGVIIPVIPFAIRVRANVAEENVQHWVSVLLAVYGAALLVAAPICGVVADRTSSRRSPLLVGLIVLGGSTVMLCLGRSIPVLVAGRLLQGASAAVVWTVALALLSDTVGKEQSGHALGYVASSYSLGVLVAPLLGGVVYERAGYYAVYGMTFGVIGFDIVLRLLIVEKKEADRWRDGEEVQSPTVIGLDEKGKAEESIPEEGTESTKRKLPTMLILLKSRRVLAAFAGIFVGASSMGAFDSTLPIFVNRTFGWNSLGAGLIFIALIIPSFAGPLIGHWTDKYGPRWLAAGGLVLALPFWVLLRLVDHDNIRQIVLLCALLVFLGVAVALTLTSLMTEFSKVCDAKEKQDPGLFGHRSAYAQSYGIFNVAWAAGTLVGPLWAAAVQKSGGWKTMTWTFGLLNAVGAIPVVLYSGGFVSYSFSKTLI